MTKLSVVSFLAIVFLVLCPTAHAETQGRCLRTCPPGSVLVQPRGHECYCRAVPNAAPAIPIAAPSISALSTSVGPFAGGTRVTISGAGFEPGARVLFGNLPAVVTTVSSSTSIIVSTPPGIRGVVDVSITNPSGGSASIRKAFTGVGLSVSSATLLADGRVIEVVFAMPLPDNDAFSTPDWQPGAIRGVSLKTNSGVELEHIGTYVTTGNLQRINPVAPNYYPTQWFSGKTLTWRAHYLIRDPSKVITWNISNLTVTGGAGLLQDSFGNSTEEMEAVAVTNKSLVDANGFTSKSFERGKGGITLYVSSSFGSDSNSIQAAQNPATPLKTPWQAMQLLQRNNPGSSGSAVRLLRGDTFPNGATIMTYGQDKMHPFLLEDYWYDYTGNGRDPGTRPVIKTVDWKTSKNPLGAADRVLNAICYTGRCSHVVVRNIQLVNSSFQFSLLGKPLSEASDFTLDNVVITGASKEGNQESDGININQTANFTLLRSIVTEAPAQGIHGDWMFEHFLVSQNVFDNNNRIMAGCTNCSITAKGDQLTHNLYLKDPGMPVIMWGNEVSNASSHGVQARAGGVIAYNHFASNAIGAFIGGVGGSLYKNVVYGARDISPTLPRGFGLSMTGNTSVSQSIENNIIVNTVGRTPFAIATATDGGSVRYGIIRHNTAAKSGNVFLARTNFTVGISGTNNIVAPSSGEDYFYQDQRFVGWYHGDNNALQYGGGASCSNIGRGTLSEWQSLSHSDGNSITTPPLFSNPNASPGSYAEYIDLIGRFPLQRPFSPPASKSNGDALTAGYISYLRNRPLTGFDAPWGPAYDMVSVYKYYAEQYRPKNLPPIGSGKFDYYGASGPLLQETISARTN